MQGPKPKYEIDLTTEEERELRKLANAYTAPYAKVVRARILLSAYDHPEWSNKQIADEAGCTRRTVRKWRKRWAETRSIEDLPRPGAPRRFSPSGESAGNGPGVQPTTREGSAAGAMEQRRDCTTSDSVGDGGEHRGQHGGAMVGVGEDQTVALP